MACLRSWLVLGGRANLLASSIALATVATADASAQASNAGGAAQLPEVTVQSEQLSPNSDDGFGLACREPLEMRHTIRQDVDTSITILNLPFDGLAGPLRRETLLDSVGTAVGGPRENHESRYQPKSRDVRLRRRAGVSPDHSHMLGTVAISFRIQSRCGFRQLAQFV